MARSRRNREDNLAAGVAQLIALAALGAMFVPPIRQALVGLGAFLVGAFVLALVVALVVLLIRRSERKSPFDSTRCTTLNATVPPLSTMAESKPHTTADLVQRLRSIDWFQFERLVALVYQKQGDPRSAEYMWRGKAISY